MNKKLLIISPYFPPSNAADMHRIRMSLPYFADYGWDAEVVTVDARHSDIAKDSLLEQSIPSHIKVHTVSAFNKKWTTKIGLGSIAIRSLWFFKQKVDELLKANKYDLIYFSTTQFPVCTLGSYWKKKFNIPYVIDMQDPWHSHYYRDKPKGQRPAKYWFSYRLNKYLEPIAMKEVAGLISVSPAYIENLKARYPKLKDIPTAVIPFGTSLIDLDIAKNNAHLFERLINKDTINIVYIGRGGADMEKAIQPLFKTFKDCLKADPTTFNKLRFYFIGTSYAADGAGQPTIAPLAKQYSLTQHVIEITNRISYYHTLVTLQQANALFIPGSDDKQYTASKIYPYLFTNKPLLSIFHWQSPAQPILHKFNAANALTYSHTADLNLKIGAFLKNVATGILDMPQYNTTALQQYEAQNMSLLQCNLFKQVVNG